MQPAHEKPLPLKELAAAANCCPWFVSMAKRAGFVMPGKRATLTEFRGWLRDNPGFVAKRHAANRRQQLPTAANM